jgi:hypothetical protein
MNVLFSLLFAAWSCSVSLSLCLSVCPSISIHVSMDVHLYICRLYVCMAVCPSSVHISYHIISCPIIDLNSINSSSFFVLDSSYCYKDISSFYIDS